MSCATCLHARGWEYTPTGCMRQAAGRCMAPVVITQQPACVKIVEHRIGVWPKDGADCKSYIKDETK